MAPVVAGGAAAVFAGTLVARRAAGRGDSRRPSTALAERFRLSHEALRRNLDRFVAVIDRGEDFSTMICEFIRQYGEFLIIHHDAEDQIHFPALRHAGRLRSTDAAHLDRWTAEHREVNALGRALGQAGERLRALGLVAVAGVRQTSLDSQRSSSRISPPRRRSSCPASAENHRRARPHETTKGAASAGAASAALREVPGALAFA